MAPTSFQKKFLSDLKGVAMNNAVGMAFVTNQELAQGQRDRLRDAAFPAKVEIYHIDRVTSVLDQPRMADVRKQFLGPDFDQAVLQKVEDLKAEVARSQAFQRHLLLLDALSLRHAKEYCTAIFCHSEG